MTKNNRKIEPSSFRDPNGYVFYKGNDVFRQVNYSYKNNFDYLYKSGLYKALVQKHYLIPHSRVYQDRSSHNKSYVILKTKKIPFISYPYEWTFDQLKDAALLTLEIQEVALQYGMSLKDATSYNIQFLNGKPVFIDILSFEIYKKDKPWIAYRQFCQHFFGPLLLMSWVDINLNKFLRIYIDGIPLNLVSTMLPKKTYLQFSVLTHIHLHALKQKQLANRQNEYINSSILSKTALTSIIDNLKTAIINLHHNKNDTEWGDYYTFTNYSNKAFKNKEMIINKYIEISKPNLVWDIGANSGLFSRIASQKNIFTVASDIDPIAVERNYTQIKKMNETNILPLVIDLVNPSPALGWSNTERRSLIQRGPADLVMALALIHHLSISNNLPFEKVADFCQKIGKYLIIEFIPKNDSQVQKLLKTREDIFDNYSQLNFEKSFSKKFKIITKDSIHGSSRICYLMKSLKK